MPLRLARLQGVRAEVTAPQHMVRGSPTDRELQSQTLGQARHGRERYDSGTTILLDKLTASYSDDHDIISLIKDRLVP